MTTNRARKTASEIVSPSLRRPVPDPTGRHKWSNSWVAFARSSAGQHVDYVKSQSLNDREHTITGHRQQQRAQVPCRKALATLLAPIDRRGRVNRG